MVLDRKVDIMLKMMKTFETPIHEMDIKSAREHIKSRYTTRTKPEEVSTVTDYSITTKTKPITIRAYQPVVLKKPGSCFLYYHGGGSVLFSIEEYDPICRHLCNMSGATVFSVDYHLAPEYRFPVQLEEAITAYQWVLKNHDELSVNTEKITVIGDSFGAYLATEVCLNSNDIGYKCPNAEILLYPRTDHHRTDLESYKAYSHGYNLDMEEMEWYWRNYLPEKFNFDDPRICPNRSPDLSSMPKSYIYTSEYDPLRDEAEEYANKLLLSGVPTKLKRVEGQIHGFIHFWNIVETPGKILEEICNLID